MKITLLTTESLENYITEEDLLAAELQKQGHQVSFLPWEQISKATSDLYLIRTTWNYTKHLELFLEKLKIVKSRLLNPYDLVYWNTNKKYLLELQEKGHPVMPLYLVEDSQSLKNKVKDLGYEEYIIKPLVSASAYGLKRFSSNDIPSINQQMILQKFYPSITQGEVSLFFFNGKFGYAVKKIPKLGDIRVQEEYGSSIIEYHPNNEELNIARNALSDIPGNWLYARVDYVPKVGIIELECIEPSMYYSKVKKSVAIFSNAITEYFYTK